MDTGAINNKDTQNNKKAHLGVSPTLNYITWLKLLKICADSSRES